MSRVWFGKIMAKTSNQLKRAEFYRNRNTQTLLGEFISGKMSELEPVYDPKFGYQYPFVDEIIGDTSKSEDFLNKLYEAGILERKLYDKIIYCPKCDSASVSVHYCCPYCKSFNIQRSSLIEHVKCGYMGIAGNFESDEKLVCPKCHEEMKKSDFDYREAGIWCTCRDCGKSFDIPDTSHFCRKCHTNSTFEDVVIKDIYVYTMKEEVKEEVSASWIALSPIKDFLEENGFEVESPAYLEGKSGAHHTFDIAAFKEGKKREVMVIDWTSSPTGEAVQEQPVIALFAKIFDVSPDNAYLVAIPRLSENGKKMAKLYNIEVVETRNQEDAAKALRHRLLKRE